LAAVSVYTFLGYVTVNMGVPLEEVTRDGIDLVFVVYPGLLSTFQLCNLWAIVFFLMMLLMGIDSMISMVDVIIVTLWDSWPAAR